MAMANLVYASDRDQVGVLAASAGVVQLKSSGTSSFTEIAPGAPIYLYDEIMTGPDTRAQILMRDETTFSIGENTELVIDEFIFNPYDHASGLIKADFKTGVFRFISGRIAKANPANMEVKAGNAVIAIRGTEVIGTITEQESTIVLLSGQIDMTSSSDFCQSGGTGCSQSLTRPGFGVEMTELGQFTAPSRFDPEEISRVIGTLQVSNAAPEKEEDTQNTEEEPQATEEEIKSEIDETEEAKTEEETVENQASETVLTVTRNDDEATIEVAEIKPEGIEIKPDEIEIKPEDIELNITEIEANLSRETAVEINTINIDGTNIDGANLDADGKPKEEFVERKLSDFDMIVMRALGVISNETETPSDTNTMDLPQDIQNTRQETAEDMKEEEERELTEQVYEEEVEEAVENLNSDKEKEESSNTSSENSNNAQPANNAPQLSLAQLGNTDDTADDDTFSPVSAQATARDADTGDTLTYGLTGSTQTSNLAGFDIFLSGSYGRLHLNNSTGAYRYVPDDEATEGLTSTVNDTFEVTVTDGTDTARENLSAVLRGVNDTPVLAVITGDTYTDTANDDTFANETGTLDGSDRDNGQTLTYAITSGSADTSQSGYTHALAGSYGTLYVNSTTGDFLYIPDDTKIEELKTSVTDTFAMTASDGTAGVRQNYRVTINGANDTPTLDAFSGFTFTDTANGDTFNNVTGSASAADRDSGETLSFSLPNGGSDTSQSGYNVAEAGSYGTLYLNTSSGTYLYVPDDSAIQAAKADETDQFSVQVSDGSLTANQTLTANIAGVNDTPILGNISAASFTDTANDDSFSNVTGTASATDLDDTVSYSITGGSSDTSLSGYTHSSSGTYGTLYINSSSGAYTYVIDDAAMEGAASTVTDTFTVSASDGTAASTSDFVATITGANDTPTLASISGITVTDTSADDTFTATSASLSGSDRDTGQTLTYSISGGSADTSLSGFTHSSSGTYGQLYVNSSTGAYRFVPDDTAVEALTSTVTEDFTLAFSDGTASVNQTLTTTIQGVNDAPTLASLTGISFDDTDASNTFNNVTGTASGSDRDTGASLAYSLPDGARDTSQSGYDAAQSGTYGTLYLNINSGAYLYIPNSSAIDGSKTTNTEQFNIQVSDGTLNETQTLTTTLNGVNDTPVLGSVSGFTLNDTANSDSFDPVNASASANDRDSGDTITYGISGASADTSLSGFTHAVTGTYGQLFINSSTGAYRFLANVDAVDGAITTTTESFTITASDGTASSTTDLVATIAGVDDTPILPGFNAITVQDTAASDTFTTTTGTAQGSNAESSQTSSYSITSGSADTSVSGFTHSRTGTYGTFYINSSSGSYQYVPNTSVIEAQNNDKNESFEISFTDGVTTVSETLMTVIRGVNDRPILNALTGISYTDTVDADTFNNTAGTASGTDVDTSSDQFKYSISDMQTVNGDPNYTHVKSGTYGDIYLNLSTGAYQFRPESSKINALTSTVTETFTFGMTDSSISSSPQTLTVTLNGVDDKPVINTNGGSVSLSTGAAGQRPVTVTDAERHTITDSSSSIAALPSWLTFGSTGSGNSVTYYWQVGANSPAWLNGSRNVQLKATANSLDSDTETVTFTFTCQSDLCGQFIKSTDTVTPVSVANATNFSNVTSNDTLSLNSTTYTLMTENQINQLFDGNSNDSGEFRVNYTANEGSSPTNPGTWTFNQYVTVDYSKREIVLNGDVAFNDIDYFDGDDGQFSYSQNIDFSGGGETYSGKNALFFDQSNHDTGIRKNGAPVRVNITDYIGFMNDGSNSDASVVWTDVLPDTNNPSGYNDDANVLNEGEWRVLEPQ